jgi:hypothetical protein
MSKAVELPINAMIIIVIAVIILLALVAMYFAGFGPFSTAVGIEGVRGAACRVLVQEKGCREGTVNVTIMGFDANRDNIMVPGTTFPAAGWTAVCNSTVPLAGSNDNLASLCRCYYGLGSESACRNLCGCS